MRQYEITLIGKTPLLMHADDIEWADTMQAWREDPKNKKISRAGDDRTPAWRWVGHVYMGDTCVAIPQDNIMRSLMEGGAQVPVPGARANKTFKAQTQSGMGCLDFHWPLYVQGKQISRESIEALLRVDDFAQQKEMTKALGFDLFVKRAKIGSSKHIRVRARFRNWQAVGALMVWDDQITEDALKSILSYAGEYKGLCDWRPGGRTPGPYGRFDAEIKIMK